MRWSVLPKLWRNTGIKVWMLNPVRHFEWFIFKD
jgi:hypothetical protein